MDYQDIGGGYTAQISKSKDGSAIECNVKKKDFIGFIRIDHIDGEFLPSMTAVPRGLFLSLAALQEQIKHLQKLEQMYIKLLGEFEGANKDEQISKV